ncbi:MAG: hypothetical protein EPO68_15135, partial [Planctomycetota bacterium]
MQATRPHESHVAAITTAAGALRAALTLAALPLVAHAASFGIALRFVAPGTAGAALPRSYAEARALLESASAGGELRIALPFAAAGFGDALALPDARITLDPARSSFSIDGALGGSAASGRIALAGAWSGADVAPRCVLGFTPQRWSLAQRIPALAGTPIDGLDLGGRTFLYTDANWDSLASLGGAAACLGDAPGALRAGWSFAGALPVSALPPRARAACGLGDDGALALDGALVADLGLLTGGGAIRELALSLRLPAGGAPRALPTWLRPLAGGASALSIAYAAPSSVSCLVARDVEVELGGAARRFRLSADAGTESAAEFRAEMHEPWKAAFGLAWIELHAATLRGSLATARATLEGRFQIAGRDATATMEIGAEGPTKLGVAIGSIALDELVSSGAIGALPSELAGPLQRVLDGAALELRSATASLDPRTRTLTLAADVSLRGAASELLYVTELPGWNGFARSASGPSAAPSASAGGASLFALRPLQLSLDRLFPKLSQHAALKELAAADLELPMLFGGSGSPSIDLPSLPRGFADAFAGLSWPALPAGGAAGATSSAAAATSGGAGGFSLGQLRLPRGLSLAARVRLPQLPAHIPLARVLGFVERLGGARVDGLDLRGTIGLSLEDLRVAAVLPPFGARAQVPWLRSGRVAVEFDGRGELSLAGVLGVAIHGEPLEFQLASSLAKDATGAALSLEGRLDGTWKRACGIDWLELADVRLALALDGDELAATCGASFPLGARTARAEIALRDPQSAALLARLDRAALSDLVALVGRSGAGGFLERSGLDTALALSDIQIELRTAQQGGASRQTSLLLGATAELAGRSADLLLAIEPGAGAAKRAVVVRLPDIELATLVPALRGTPADLKFPSLQFGLGEGVGGGVGGGHAIRAQSPSFDLGRWGGDGAGVPVGEGLRLGGKLPLAALPAQLKQALGFADAALPLEFEGTLDGALGALSGKSALRGIDLAAKLPASTRAPNLPPFLTAVDGGARDLRVRYAAGTGVSIAFARDVDVELAGARRRFRMTAQLGSGEQAGGAFEAAMSEPWRSAFGLPWMELRAATLRGRLGSGGAAGATLEGNFELAGRDATVALELSGGGAQQAAGRLVVRTDRIGLSDLAQLGIAERLPTDALDRIGAARLEVREPAISIELGRERSLSFSGRVALGDTQADVFLAIAGKAGGRPAPVLLFKPDRLTLGSLAAPLLDNELTRELALRELSGLLVLAGSGAKSIAAADLPAAFASCVPTSARTGKAEAELLPGLNLMAPLSLDALPTDGPLGGALQRLRAALGVGKGGLALSGTLGRRPADLALRAEFPPIAPRGGPAWLESGQLALEVTGKPSLAIAGTLGLHVDGEHLVFGIDGSIARVGAAPAVKLFGSLEGDRPWKSPLGIEWLELQRVGLGLTFDATASATPSFSGAMRIGRKDLEVAAALRVNASGVPIGGMFRGASDAGFALADFAELQARIAGAAGRSGPVLPLAALPDVALRAVELTLAPRDYPEERVEQGFKLRGTLLVPATRGGAATRSLASIDLSVDRSGISGKGALGARKLGPVALRDARIELALRSGDQRFELHGDAQVLGREQVVAVKLTRQQVALDARVDLGGRWQADVHCAAPFDLELPKFSAAGLLPDDLLGDVRAALQQESDLCDAQLTAALAAAQQQLEDARKRRDERQKLLADTKAKLQQVIATATSALETARKDAVLARKWMDEAREAWEGTPDSNPVLKAARKKAYELARAAYEIG